MRVEEFGVWEPMWVCVDFSIFKGVIVTRLQPEDINPRSNMQGSSY